MTLTPSASAGSAILRRRQALGCLGKDEEGTMSVWKRLRDSAITGAGFAIGASAGRDLYDAAKKRVGEVDWQKVRSDAGEAADRLGRSVQDLADNLQQRVAPSPSTDSGDEAVRQAEELLEEAAKEPVNRTL